MRGTGADRPVVAVKPGNAGGAKGAGHPGSFGGQPRCAGGAGERVEAEAAKPFVISKWVVWEAYEKVKANQGAAGVDGESIAEFEGDLKGNLYKLWNRMSSGSYFPPPVRAVEIPKAGGKGVRTLGVPTVSRPDRPDGRRAVFGAGGGAAVPSRLLRLSAGAVGAGRGGGVPGAVLASSDWVIDLDIRSFFDSLDSRPRPARRCRSTRTCGGSSSTCERWLKAPLQREDGTWCHEIAGPRRARRSHPCWRTCSSTTRSIPGWPGASRTSGSSATRTTRWCTAQPRPRHEHVLGCHRRADGAGRSGAASGQDAHRVLQGPRPPRLA